MRHLQYTADAKSLFLSTSLTADIQSYSTEHGRLLDPSKAHASPPVSLAISSTGHLMVSASDGPPVVYLKDLAQNSGPLLIEPRASRAAVSVAAFHPERPNIFLLAFRDGTLATYDASRILRTPSGSIANQENVNKGEICHVSSLHRSASIANKRAAITDAAFLPGFKSRVISVGADGRCRLVDFSSGTSVVRTWHAHAPLTSVSVLCLKAEQPQRARGTSAKRASHLIGGPTSTDNVIAVGRIDGQVHVYDSLGLLVSQKTIGHEGEQVISVEWARGPSPKAIDNDTIAGTGISTPAFAAPFRQENIGLALESNTIDEVPHAKRRRSTNFDHVGLPQALRKPKAGTTETTTTAPRRFTIHPDEVEDSTVRHMPALVNSEQAPVATAQYFDLFSPVKPPSSRRDAKQDRGIASPPRTRPRISSQTFIKSPTSPTQRDTIRTPRNLALFPSTDSAPVTDPILSYQGPSNPSTKRTRRTPFDAEPRRMSETARTVKPSPTPPNTDAKILADLRKMSAIHPAHRPGSVLNNLILDATVPTPPSRKRNKRNLLHRSTDHIETNADLNSLKARKAYDEAHEQRHWPADSTQASSLDETQETDMWLTSDADEQEKKGKGSHRSCGKEIQSAQSQPPARQSSRIASAVPHTTDGSTGSTQQMHTAATHLSPTTTSTNGTVSPSSNDLRALFPRSSSLSPHRSQRSKTHRSKKTTTQAKVEAKPKTPCSPEVLAKEMGTAAIGKGNRREEVESMAMKSPWERAREGKTTHEDKATVVRSGLQTLHEGGDAPREVGRADACSLCTVTAGRVRRLENETAALRAQVLALAASRVRVRVRE